MILKKSIPIDLKKCGCTTIEPPERSGVLGPLS